MGTLSTASARLTCPLGVVCQTIPPSAITGPDDTYLLLCGLGIARSYGQVSHVNLYRTSCRGPHPGGSDRYEVTRVARVCLLRIPTELFVGYLHGPIGGGQGLGVWCVCGVYGHVLACEGMRAWDEGTGQGDRANALQGRTGLVTCMCVCR